MFERLTILFTILGFFLASVLSLVQKRPLADAFFLMLISTLSFGVFGAVMGRIFDMFIDEDIEKDLTEMRDQRALERSKLERDLKKAEGSDEIFEETAEGAAGASTEEE